jgi:ribokinase
MGMYHRFVPGGKGANQAVAAAHLGGQVSLVGCIGEDYLGKMVLDNLKEKKIDVAGVTILKETPTGAAFITVDESGENSIVLSAGANAEFSEEMVGRNAQLITRSDMLLVQLEIPLTSVERAVETAIRSGKMVAVNPAPALPIPADSIIWKSTLFVLNEIEAEFYTGIPVGSAEDAFEAGRMLLERGVKIAVVTLGEKGSAAVGEDVRIYVKAIQTDVVDTTAAGDTYIGGFCTHWIESGTIQEAMEFASCAAGISVSRFGAQTSIPKEEEVLLRRSCFKE